MEDELRRIIARIAETPKVDFPIDADLRDDLQVDSHRAVEMVFEIERVFGITIPVDRANELRTLRSALALVTELKGGGK